MASKSKNPVLLVLAFLVLGVLTLIGKAKLHNFGPPSDGSSYVPSLIVGLSVIVVFCGAIYYIRKP